MQVGWCPWCKIFSYGEDPDDGIGSPVCHQCKWKLEPGDTANVLDLLCDRCARPIKYRTARCDCGMMYFDDYWDELDETFEEGGFSDLVDPDDVIDAVDAYDVTLCCAKDVDDCTCEGGSVVWIDLKHVPKSIYENIYAYRAKCSGCRFFYTPQCIPLRAWTTEFVQTGSMAGLIDECSYFQLEPLCLS